ncbi:MAG: sugar-binding protein [Phycisphaerales bacterium]
MLIQKWCYVGVLTLLSLSAAMAGPPAVHPVTGEPLVLTCLKGTPAAIDGDLSDWNLAAMTPAVLDVVAQIYTGQASWTNPEDCSARFYVEWDDAKIYLAVVVKDERLSMNKSGANIWNADCIEVFFSMPDAVATHSATTHYQFGFNANRQKWNWCNMDGTGEVEPAYLEIASSRTPDGYICEVSIEYGRMASLNFAAGNAIGFHPVLDDTDDGDREIQMTWTSREAHDQTLGFGQIILSPDPAIARELSRGPSPAHGAIDVPVDAVLSWAAGEFAVGHDVYLGTTLADINDADRANPGSVLVGQGQTATQYDPEGLLEYGQTYYWRVDEVNGVPDNTVFTGEVWSFTTEPFGYPIPGPITTKASSQQPASTASRTCDGSGLDDFDQHSYDVTDMWVTNPGLPAWIQYTFDKEYKLHELWVWNGNSELEMFMGFGAKEVAVEYSTDGENWMQVENVPEFAQGTGQESYTVNTVVSLGGVAAKYVRLTINTTWGFTGIASLSEVRFFYVPVQAFGPAPANGATGVERDTVLNWRPSREASSHEVYFGTDSSAVAEGAVPVKTVTGHTYEPGVLDFGTTYYWKVDEVGDAGVVEGELWSFTSQEYEPIDDFESYDDNIDGGTTIWQAWIDGLTNGTGSYVGYENASGGTFAETAIVHAGRQSMPVTYDNTKSPYYSEAERTFAPVQNWTASGADTLSLYFQGVATNSAESLYVTVKDNSKSKTVAHSNAAAVQGAEWQQWKIPLSEFTSAGVKVTAVKALVIGVGNSAAPTAGGTGVVYIDDIGFGRSVQ